MVRQYLLKFSQSPNWPDMSLRITGFSPEERARYDHVSPEILDGPLRAMLGALEGGILDLETTCSIGYPRVSLRPVQGRLEKAEACGLAEAMIEDLLYESEILYNIDVGPDAISFSYMDDLEDHPEPERLREMTGQLKYICQIYGFDAQQKGPSSRLLDVSVQGRVTRWLAVGRRNAKTVIITPDVDAVITMDYSDELLQENSTLGDCRVMSRWGVINLMGRECIASCIEWGFRTS